MLRVPMVLVFRTNRTLNRNRTPLNAGVRVPVVRYDTAHGFAHRDRLDLRGGLIDKHPLRGKPPLKEAPSTGVQDTRANWRRYRQHFLADQTRTSAMTLTMRRL